MSMARIQITHHDWRTDAHADRGPWGIAIDYQAINGDDGQPARWQTANEAGDMRRQIADAFGAEHIWDIAEVQA